MVKQQNENTNVEIHDQVGHQDDDDVVLVF